MPEGPDNTGSGYASWSDRMRHLARTHPILSNVDVIYLVAMDVILLKIGFQPHWRPVFAFISIGVLITGWYNRKSIKFACMIGAVQAVVLLILEWRMRKG